MTLNERLEQIGGCGDGNCKVYVRPGMHTNGGCRCFRLGPIKAERVVNAYREEVARLTAQLGETEDRMRFNKIDTHYAFRARVKQLEAQLAECNNLDGFEIAGYRVTGIYEGREGTDVVDSLHRAEEIAEVMTDCRIEPLYVRLTPGDKP